MQRQGLKWHVAYRAYGMRTFEPELLRAVRMLAMGTLGIFAAVPGPP